MGFLIFLILFCLFVFIFVGMGEGEDAGGCLAFLFAVVLASLWEEWLPPILDFLATVFRGLGIILMALVSVLDTVLMVLVPPILIGFIARYLLPEHRHKRKLDALRREAELVRVQEELRLEQEAFFRRVAKDEDWAKLERGD
jgi:hypothetical protein